MNDPKVYYTVTITRYWQEEGEIGKQWRPTGKKDADGHDVYDYTPSLIGAAEKSKQVLSQYVDHEIDIPAIQRLLNRKPKAEGVPA
jgi:hypothetical protein